jgi:hypothetical protein
MALEAVTTKRPVKRQQTKKIYNLLSSAAECVN